MKSQQKEVARQKGKCTRVCAHAELLRQLFSFVTSVLPGVLSEASDTWAVVEGKLGMCTRLSGRGERRASAEGQPHVCVHANLPREVLSSVDRYAGFPEALSVVFPRCFLFHRVLRLLYRGDTGVCMCTHRDSMFLVSTV